MRPIHLVVAGLSFCAGVIFVDYRQERAVAAPQEVPVVVESSVEPGESPAVVTDDEGVSPAGVDGNDRKPLPDKDTGYRLKRGDPNDRSIVDNGETLPQPGDQTMDQPEGETFNEDGPAAAADGPCCDNPDCTCPPGQCPCPPVGPQQSQASPEAEPIIGYYFSAEWCVKCKISDPVMEELVASGLNIEIVDFDQRKELARRYNVTGLPTFVRFDGPNYRWQRGAIPRERIIDFYGFTEAPAMSAATSRTATPRVYASGSYGSGTVIGDGQLLTCAHIVIDPVTKEYRSPIRVVFGDELIPATVVKHDEQADLALLAFEADAAVIPVAESSPAEGAIVSTHGYPGMSKQPMPRRINLRSRIGNQGAMPHYRFASSTFQQGESGGGVTDASGRLVGVITSTDSQRGFVASHSAITSFLVPQLVAGRGVPSAKDSPSKVQHASTPRPTANRIAKVSHR